MEGEVGADRRQHISEESVHRGNCREKAERKIKKEMDRQFPATYQLRSYVQVLQLDIISTDYICFMNVYTINNPLYSGDNAQMISHGAD